MHGDFPMDVSFPGLGIDFTINNSISIFGFKIYWYAIIIVTGLVLAVIYGFKRSKFFGLKNDPMLDVIIIGFICSIICARLYYVIFSARSYDSFFDVINLRDGGLAIYGAVIGAFVSGVISCRWRKIRTMAMFDVAGIGFLIGQAIGRWGNFMNQEAFGGATDLPWGMISSNTMKVVADSPVHPCFLYESIWCLVGLVGLHILSRKWYKFYGQYFLLYLLWYGMGRFWIEGLRTDSLYLIPGVLRVSQLIAALSLATIPLIVLGLKGKVFTRRITDENGCAINAMYDAPAGSAVEAAGQTDDTAESADENKTQEEAHDASDN